MYAMEVFWLLNRLSQLLIKTLFSTYNTTYISKVFAHYFSQPFSMSTL